MSWPKSRTCHVYWGYYTHATYIGVTIHRARILDYNYEEEKNGKQTRQVSGCEVSEYVRLRTYRGRDKEIFFIYLPSNDDAVSICHDQGSHTLCREGGEGGYTPVHSNHDPVHSNHDPTFGDYYPIYSKCIVIITP